MVIIIIIIFVYFNCRQTAQSTQHNHPPHTAVYGVCGITVYCNVLLPNFFQSFTWFVCIKVRSFIRYCGQGSSLLWTPALRPKALRLQILQNGIVEMVWNEKITGFVNHFNCSCGVLQLAVKLCETCISYFFSVMFICQQEVFPPVCKWPGIRYFCQAFAR